MVPYTQPSGFKTLILAMKDTYGMTSRGMTKFTKGVTKRFNNAGANLSRVGSNLISSNKKKNDVGELYLLGLPFDMGHFIKNMVHRAPWLFKRIV